MSDSKAEISDGISIPSSARRNKDVKKIKTKIDFRQLDFMI
jgi:hypothetical protein